MHLRGTTAFTILIGRLTPLRWAPRGKAGMREADDDDNDGSRRDAGRMPEWFPVRVAPYRVAPFPNDTASLPLRLLLSGRPLPPPPPPPSSSQTPPAALRRRRTPNSPLLPFSPDLARGGSGGSELDGPPSRPFAREIPAEPRDCSERRQPTTKNAFAVGEEEQSERTDKLAEEGKKK